jgi:hypothetical protein
LDQQRAHANALAMAAPGGAGIVGVGTLSTKVDLMLAADKLPSADLLSKADPFVVVEKRVGAAWVEIGRTEVVDNNNSPTYVSVVSWRCGVVGAPREVPRV